MLHIFYYNKEETKEFPCALGFVFCHLKCSSFSSATYEVLWAFFVVLAHDNIV